MTKENWKIHIEKSENLIRPSKGGDKILWQSKLKEHVQNNCLDCKARKKTNSQNLNRRMKEDALRSLGLVKCIANGKTFWE